MTATTNDGFTQTTATGGETTIDFDFLIYGKDDIAFYETDLSGVITLLVRGTDYSIADSELNDQAGGEIVLDVGQYPSGATAGHKFTCISDIGETRSSDFQQGGDFFAQTLNTNLDRLTRVTQQLRRDVDKAARLKVDSLVASVTFTDDPQDGYGIVWDGVLGNFRNTASGLAVLEGNAAIVAANIASVNTVATNIASVNTVAGISANVTTVAGIAAAVTTVAGIAASVSAVAAVDSEVVTVAGIDTEVVTVAGIAAAVVTVAGIAADVSAVAAIDSDVTTVAGVASDIPAVAAIASDISAVAAIDTAVSTVATNIADVNTCATNIAAIIAAPDYATEAYNWAQYPEDSPVPEGSGTEYSAYHWAQKAADFATGDASNINVDDAGFTVLTGTDVQAVLDDVDDYLAALSITAANTSFDNTGTGLSATNVQDAIEEVTTPPGAIMDYAGTSAPTGWLLCYGQTVSRTTYARLFTAIGTTFGAGDGSTTFGLPDCRGRVSAGKDDMGGSSANRLTNQSGGLNGDNLGATGGAETVTLTSTEMPSHTHSGSSLSTNSTGAHTHTFGTTGGSSYRALETTATFNNGATWTTSSSGSHSHTISGNTGSTGSDGAHNNVQPTIIFNKIIKI